MITDAYGNRFFSTGNVHVFIAQIGLSGGHDDLPQERKELYLGK